MFTCAIYIRFQNNHTITKWLPTDALDLHVIVNEKGAFDGQRIAIWTIMESRHGNENKQRLQFSSQQVEASFNLIIAAG
eukprot:scaffold307847_cov17-Prasinocladus_malaysianus.AAC.1